MGFTQAIQTCLNKYADFTGRAARSEYWWWIVFNLCVMFALMLLDAVIGGGLVGNILIVLVYLALLLPSIAVTVRRFHDKDMAGWWVLIAFFPYIGGIALLIICALKGTEGDNRFGPDPLISSEHST